MYIKAGSSLKQKEVKEREKEKAKKSIKKFWIDLCQDPWQIYPAHHAHPVSGFEEVKTSLLKSAGREFQSFEVQGKN